MALSFFHYQFRPLKKVTFCCLLVLLLSQLYAQDGDIYLLRQKMASEVADEVLTQDDIRDFYIGSTHTSSTSGITYFYIQQRYQGIDIDGALATVGRSKDGAYQVFTNRWIKHIEEHIDGSPPAYDLSQITQRLGQREGIARRSQSKKIDAKPLWIKERDQLKFVIEVFLHDDNTTWRIFSDVEGNILERQNMAIKCTHNHKHRHQSGWTSTSHQCVESMPMLGDSYLVYPLGTASPSHAPQSVVTDPADNKASPFGWHDTDGADGPEFFDTRGNNVQVQEDTLARNFGGFRPSGGEDLSFLFTHDPNLGDESQVSGALTNLFYWININHDILYHHGFDTPAGNFQQNNYGNMGADGDPIIADALDGSGTNNAIFYPAPDGEENRLETFLWTGSIFDTELILGDPANPLLRIPAVQNQFSQASQLNGVGSVVGLGTQVVDGTGSTLACDAGQIQSPSQLNNRLAVVDRGECFFIVKAENVAQHGASAMIVIQNLPANPFPMGGSNGTLTIPSVMISKSAGDELRQVLDANPSIPITLQLKPPDISRGASFDNAVITHEYAHGLTSRLTGGKQTITCLLNFEQMSEGWSDYFALMFTTNWGSVGATDRLGIGTYLVGDAIEGPGIRVYPYTTDFAVNPLTYDDLPLLQIPHGIGELWAAILWDLTWTMIKQDGVTTDLYNGVGGNTNALKLVIEALKIQPCSPGFVDGRDALLQAATNLGWEKYHYAIWSAFARRGLGESADQGRVDSPLDGVSSFDIPAAFETVIDKLILEPEQSQVKLSWETVQEFGTASFSIERSVGGSNNQLINNQSAAYISTAPTSYQAIDENVEINTWYTYDLSVTNTDGSRTFLASDSIIIISTDGISVFPVPAKEELFVAAGDLNAPITRIVIFDNGGQLIYEDNNELSPLGSRRISVSHLPGGMYYLQSQAGEDVFWEKFVVL